MIRNIVVFLFELFVMLFALFYFLRDGDSMLGRFRHFLPFEETMTERMLAEARELIFASVTTSLVIAAVQGIICGGAFAMVGLGSPIFWGVVMGFLSLLPVVGAWPIWIPAVIWLFSTGHAGRAVDPDCHLRGAGRHDRQYFAPGAAGRARLAEWIAGVHQRAGRHRRVRRAGSCPRADRRGHRRRDSGCVFRNMDVARRARPDTPGRW